MLPPDRLGEYRRRSKNRRLIGNIATAVTVAGALTALISLASRDNPPAQTIPLIRELPTPRPTETPKQSTQELFNLTLKPGTPLAEELTEIYFKSGERIGSVYDCTNGDSTEGIRAKVVNPVARRTAPSTMGGFIEEIGPDSPKKDRIAKIEIHMDDPILYKSSVRKWLAEIEGTNISFIAKEQQYRAFLLTDLKSQCNEFKFTDYLTPQGK